MLRATRTTWLALLCVTALVAAGCDRLQQLPLPQAVQPASPTPAVKPAVEASATPAAPRAAAPRVSPVPAAQFVGGFKAFHDIAPELIGEPLREEYGPWPGMSTQQTTNGMLIWVENQDLVFVATDGRMFTWNAAENSLKIVSPP